MFLMKLSVVPKIDAEQAKQPERNSPRKEEANVGNKKEDGEQNALQSGVSETVADGGRGTGREERQKERGLACFANSQETANAEDKVVSERDDRRTDAGP